MVSFTKKGFTLIELLIVVAIIAILAAIAVPNFLEAQVRAKVSRVKNDMRTIATALEAYRLDHNQYPTDGPPPNRTIPGDTNVNLTLGLELTTPISYISTLEIARDIFRSQRPDLKNNPALQGRIFFIYTNYPLRWSYAQSGTPGMPTITQASYNAGIRDYGDWRLVSAGPDEFVYWNGDNTDRRDFNNFAVMLYDPTNGTVSIGDVYRSQKFGDSARMF